jgi:hypothetical protein
MYGRYKQPAYEQRNANITLDILEGLTIQHVADLFDLSRNRIRQIFTNTLNRATQHFYFGKHDWTLDLIENSRIISFLYRHKIARGKATRVVLSWVDKGCP